jgi:hypothetical protein
MSIFVGVLIAALGLVAGYLINQLPGLKNFPGKNGFIFRVLGEVAFLIIVATAFIAISGQNDPKNADWLAWLEKGILVVGTIFVFDSLQMGWTVWKYYNKNLTPQIVIPLGLLFGLLSLSAISVIFWPKQEWKPYPISDYGLQIEKPTNWEGSTEDPKQYGDTVVGVFYPPKQSTLPCGDRLFINITKPKPMPQTIAEYKRNINREVNTRKIIGIVNEDPNTRLSDLPAIRLNYKFKHYRCDVREVIDVGTIRKGTAYLISFQSDPKTFNENLSTVERIINSFKINEISP